MTKKKQPYASIDKVIGITGIVLVVVGCAANLYSAVINQRFIHDGIDIPYYLRYFILLGGGFLTGIGFYKSQKKPLHTMSFTGTVFALLAMSLFFLLDTVRVLAFSFTETPPYPWGRILFESIPILALLLTAASALYLRRAAHTLVRAQHIFIASFLAVQLYLLLSNLYYLATTTTEQPDPLWSIAISFLVNPFIMSLVAFLLLGKVSKVWDRLFYSVSVGAFVGFFSIVLWELQTNPMLGDIRAFTTASISILLVLAVFLISRIRFAIK